jgi:uncharacterized cupredoxin-like copper-binding protein
MPRAPLGASGPGYLELSVRLPAKGTAAVVVKSDQAGALEYYCSVPGHKGAGMVGELTMR